jgi:hypothetical protein
MEYKADSGRVFSVTQEPSGDYYAYELVPVLRDVDAAEYNQNMLDDPNGYQKLLANQNITPWYWRGGGHPQDAKYWGTLDEVSAYIAMAVVHNAFCDGIDHEPVSGMKP